MRSANRAADRRRYPPAVKCTRSPWARPADCQSRIGMKVLVNGGINLSELDGWWAEAYSRTSAGRWGMARSMARLTPRFFTNRTVREYTEQHCLPAAAAYRPHFEDETFLEQFGHGAVYRP